MNAIDRAFIRAYVPDDQLDAPGGERRAAAAYTQQAGHGPATGAADLAATAAPHFRLYASAGLEPTTPASAPPISAPAAVQRRPLSTFAPPPSAVEGQFRPSLEVDAFRWSATCIDLCKRQRSRWRGALEALLAHVDMGRSLIGVAGESQGAGCTTVIGCLARLLAEAGRTVAIVDGNFTTPELARSLGLVVEIGWEDVLAGRVPLAESVVYSLQDAVAVLPLVRGGAPAAEKLDGIHASVTAGVLRYHYDVVLFDLGAVADERQGPVARRLARRCRLDGALLLSASPGSRTRQTQWLMDAAPELAAICLGVVENQL